MSALADYHFHRACFILYPVFSLGTTARRRRRGPFLDNEEALAFARLSIGCRLEGLDHVRFRMAAGWFRLRDGAAIDGRRHGPGQRWRCHRRRPCDDSIAAVNSIHQDRG